MQCAHSICWIFTQLVGEFKLYFNYFTVDRLPPSRMISLHWWILNGFFFVLFGTFRHTLKIAFQLFSILRAKRKWNGKAIEEKIASYQNYRLIRMIGKVSKTTEDTIDIMRTGKYDEWTENFVKTHNFSCGHWIAPQLVTITYFSNTQCNFI